MLSFINHTDLNKIFTLILYMLNFLFLYKDLYYQTIQNHTGQPEWKQLLSINKYGGFSKFSKQQFEDWSLWKDMLTEIGLTEKLIEVKN